MRSEKLIEQMRRAPQNGLAKTYQVRQVLAAIDKLMEEGSGDA